MDGNKNILVVDDSDVTRQYLKDIFGRTAFNVITCNDGLEGIKKAIEFKPALILLDILMPNFDGIKMLQVVRLLEGLEEVPVIVISANANRSNVIAATEAGADKIIPKPIQKQVLLDSIKEILGESVFNEIGTPLQISSGEENDLKRKLKDYFIENFTLKGKGIVKALDNENVPELKILIHNIRGAGGAIGYPNLTDLCANIEDMLEARIVDWWTIREKCDKIFSIVEDMKVEQEGIKKW